MIKVGIVGLGLIGGSLGKALRKIRHPGGHFVYHVVGFSRKNSTVKKARRQGVIDTGTSHPSILAASDIIVLAVPVQFTGAVVKKILPFIKRGAILTDAGSVKASVARDVRRAIGKKQIYFVGAHPLAGSERSGLANADAALFKNSFCVIVGEGAPNSAVRRVERLWSSVGARPVRLPAARHDRYLAATSHLPHVLAFSLFAEVEKLARRDARVRSLVAGSFRDMTRIAASSPEVWSGILTSNRAELLQAWKKFRSQVDTLFSRSPSSLTKHLDRVSQSKLRWTKN